MEDISRELEREIAQSKPKPYKQDRKTRILIVDDFGKMTSGGYLKKLVWGLSGVSLFCIVAAVVFFILYSEIAKESKIVNAEFIVAQKKVVDLTREKEVLMARLVFSGKEPGIESGPESETEKQDPAQPSALKNPVAIAKIEKKENSNKKMVAKPEIKVSEKINKQVAPILPVKETVKIKDKSIELPAVVAENLPQKSISKKNVSIEKFTVKKDGVNGNLLVRFDIRNISTESGDVSGRIFTILMPEDPSLADRLVVPTAKLKDGVPAEYRKGQYFSIAHFKPVKFKIKNHTDPELFKKASIFIFNNQGELIVEKLIDITEAE